MGSHINHSDTETSNLRTELRESVSTVEAKLVINSMAVEKVEDKLNRLTELIQKEAKERTEVAVARENQKRMREEVKRSQEEKRRQTKKKKEERKEKEKKINAIGSKAQPQ